MAAALLNVVQRKIKGPPTTSDDSKVIFVRVWDVVAPPPLTSAKGVFLPQMISFFGRRRRISIEVHEVRAKNGRGSYEECIVRVLVSDSNVKEFAKKTLAGKKSLLRFNTNQAKVPEMRKNTPTPEEEEEEENNRNTNNYGEGAGSENGDEESTVAQPGNIHPESRRLASPNYHGWVEKYRFPIRSMNIKGTSRTAVFISIQLGRVLQRRQIIFETLEEAQEFVALVHREKERDDERSGQKLTVIFQGKPPPEIEQTITFLIEVVSGWDLPIADLFRSDPYVLCSFNGKIIHRTSIISNTLDPIWTVKTGSLFLFTVKVEDLFISEGILFEVMDYDTLGSHELLGRCVLPPQTIYEGKGQRLQFKLTGAGTSSMKSSRITLEEQPGYLALRCRRASQSDIDFMNNNVYISKHKMVEKSTMDKAVSEYLGGANIIQSYLVRQTRIVKQPGTVDVKQYKIRPGPDPKRPEETTWMTKEQIDEEILQESTHWIDIGTGSLGRLFVEVLKCDNLPNLDMFGRNKTDSFVCLLYEDAFIRTDVIDDCLSPRWLPWMKRAAIYHIYHSSSSLFLGVFDHDTIGNHDLVGRVTVDLANLRPDTVYVLTYNIYTTANLNNRDFRGTVTLRLRMEIEDERQLLLSNLQLPPEFFVNVKSYKEYMMLKQTCEGLDDTSKYDIKTIKNCIAELYAYQHLLLPVKDALINVALWRGTTSFTIGKRTISLPTHSLTIFLSLVLVVERPQLAPAWFSAVIGFGMLATMEFRRQMPGPWLKCKSYHELFSTLVFGFSPFPSVAIQPNEDAEEANRYLEAIQKRIQEAAEVADKAYEEHEKAQEAIRKEMQELGDISTDISTNNEGFFTIDPTKQIFFPIQQTLLLVCRYARLAKYIATWEECYLSFWFTTGCFVVSFTFIFVPWFFLLKWLFRLLVWTLLGPWMKLVDIFYVSKISNVTLNQRLEKLREQQLIYLEKYLHEKRIVREKAMKHKAMKTYMFGRFISRVPVWKEDSLKDLPLSQSYAVPYAPKPLPFSEIAMQEAGYKRTRVNGQHLVGDMIPRIEKVNFTEAPIGQPIKQRKLVDQHAHGGILAGGPETTLQAYLKIASLILLSSLISWFAVPFVSWLIYKLVPKSV